MRFLVVDSVARIPSGAKDVCYLIHSNWNDWYQYETAFVLHYYDTAGVHSLLGEVKIGQSGMQGASDDIYGKLPDRKSARLRVTHLPADEFETLPEDYFSLGMSDSYYEFLGRKKRTQSVLVALRDMAYNKRIYKKFRHEDVAVESVLRGISEERVMSRFANLAHNRPSPTMFEFEYKYPVDSNGETTKLVFAVSPDSVPPSNVKVLIGRNGVGKTLLLRNVLRCLCEESGGENTGSNGALNIVHGGIYGVLFASLSPFERFPLRTLRKDRQFRCIGCVKYDEKTCWVKKVSDLAGTFAEAIEACRVDPLRDRWLGAVDILCSDPVLAMLDVKSLLDVSGPNCTNEVKKYFNQLSTGHKALLLMVTQLVRVLDEKFLVLIDEPESHLHPPLLASFIRCLSFLLRERNAVALVATHSPLILQEVTSGSAWILNRCGESVSVSHPSVETFGENSAVLMNAVFGLEMETSGYHKILTEIVEDSQLSYAQIVERFGGLLGVEAKAILRVLIAHRDSQTGDVPNHA